MTGFEEKYDDCCWSIKNRLLGICYDMRHAFMEDRDIKLVDNGVHNEMMKWHSMILPKQEVHFSVNVMFPEAVFVALSAPELYVWSCQYYRKRTKRQEENAAFPTHKYSSYIRDKEIIMIKGVLMNIIVAIDSFKGSLSSLQAGTAAEQGILRALPDATVSVRPVADGGEGTVAALVSGLKGKYVTIPVIGPLGQPVEATYGILPDQTAVIEMAEAAGLPLVPTEARNPMKTTTYGVGELIRHALDQGCQNFIIGIGGSATNDGGTGMLHALGCHFRKADGTDIAPGACELPELASIDCSELDPRLAESYFAIACDVTNPLCGPQGASIIFAPQKGADPDMVLKLDAALWHLADISAEALGKDFRDQPGAGAAGGLGFAFAAYLQGCLRPGVDLVMSEL